MTSKQKADLLQGTLDLLILKALGLGSMHGYGVGRRIMRMASDSRSLWAKSYVLLNGAY